MEYTKQLPPSFLCNYSLLAEKSLTSYKHCMATNRTPVYYQHSLHTTSKTQHYTIY